MRAPSVKSVFRMGFSDVWYMYQGVANISVFLIILNQHLWIQDFNSKFETHHEVLLKLDLLF